MNVYYECRPSHLSFLDLTFDPNFTSAEIPKDPSENIV